MPPVVSLPTPTAVLPDSLCRAFVAVDDWPGLRNDYPDGASQRSALTTSHRRRWRIGRRLTAADLVTLRTFYDTNKDDTVLFYDPFDWPLFTHDPLGVNPDCRYSVRFDGPWQQSLTLGRTDADLQLVEVAATVGGAEYLWFNQTASSGYVGVL